MKQKEKEVLFIEMKKDIHTIINEYVKEAGISQSDLGFAMGYISSKLKDKTSFEQLMFLFQMHFFAGVYYARSTKGFTYAYMNLEERKKHAEEIKKKIEGLLKPKVDKPSYLG
jgi:hypothetical protein